MSKSPVVQNNSEPADLQDSMPTYPKVGTFLYKVLTKELQAGCKAPEFKYHTSGNKIMAAFKTQFESADIWSQPIQYWNAMSQLPEASILAFVTMKIFSILTNSMPEECTVSRFTCNNSVDQAIQDASTIVDMTKIYQHNQWEASSTKKSSQKTLKSLSLNWHKVTPSTNPTADSEKAPNVASSAACELGLAAVNTVDPKHTTSSTSATLVATSISSKHDGVDITAPFFRDLLADKPSSSANAIGSLADWSERVLGSTEKGKKTARNTMWEGEVDALEF
ncbi:hypothetical protein B0H10DRAFT_2184924 [Mycena sp. CBHHK59/15]|nr:hypothetical protein B0H10DRAFT_2184924 [Mycena sp. CBHHK59/15]